MLPFRDAARVRRRLECSHGHAGSSSKGRCATGAAGRPMPASWFQVIKIQHECRLLGRPIELEHLYLLSAISSAGPDELCLSTRLTCPRFLPASSLREVRRGPLVSGNFVLLVRSIQLRLQVLRSQYLRRARYWPRWRHAKRSRFFLDLEQARRRGHTSTPVLRLPKCRPYRRGGSRPLRALNVPAWNDTRYRESFLGDRVSFHNSESARLQHKFILRKHNALGYNSTLT